MSYDSDVVAATSGIGGDADWDKIIKLCDRIRDSYGPTAMGSALNAVMKRVKNLDQSVQLQALTLLEACVSNCGKDFQLELTKSSFHAQVREVLFSRTMSQKALSMLKSLLITWSSDYRNDKTMSGLVKFVDQLVSEGVIAVQGGPTGGGSTTSQPSSQSAPVEDDLQKAIRLSLEEAKSSNNTNVTMYPSFSPQQNKKSSAGKKVRALYDFEAVEDNELSFKAGEIITVTNDSDDKWWRGETQLGSGLFPVNFVSTDLNATPEPVAKAKKTSNGGGNSSASTGRDEGSGKSSAVINEAQVDLLLEMLKTADITSTNQEENKTLKDLEAECTQMRVLVGKESGKYQKQLDNMAEVSDKLQEAFQLYRRLLQEGPRLSEKVSVINQQQQQYLPPQSHDGPPPYQTDGTSSSYFAPPPPPEGGFQTLPSHPSLGYSQPHYGNSSITMASGGGGYNQIQYLPSGTGGPPSIAGSMSGQQSHHQPLQYQPPWNAGGSGPHPTQLSTSPSSGAAGGYQHPMTVSQPLM